MPLPCRLKPLYHSQGQISSVEFGEVREKQRQRDQAVRIKSGIYLCNEGIGNVIFFLKFGVNLTIYAVKVRGY